MQSVYFHDFFEHRRNTTFIGGSPVAMRHVSTSGLPHSLGMIGFPDPKGGFTKYAQTNHEWPSDWR